MTDSLTDTPAAESGFYHYLNAVLMVAVCTAVCFFMFPHLSESNLIMVYLLGVTVVAVAGETRPAILASALSVLTYDFFFITPYYSFSVSDIQYFFTLVVMLSVAQIISHLTIHARRNIEITQYAQKETEKERFRNILLTSVSHDLRTPLTAIMGSASSMLHAGSELTAESQRELTQNIFDESERLSNLVNNILKIIRLEAGAVQLTKQSFAIDELIGSVLAKMEKQLANKPVTVTMPDDLPLIPFDNMLMEQVLINLLENSIKFAPDQSPIEIAVEMKSQQVTISISDRGPGIAAGEIDKIFDKFYRGQKPETTGIGLGLGLAICKGIIVAHKGKIWAQPRPDGGTTFCFSLPMTSHE